MIVLKNILAFITDPKNTRMLLLGGIVVLFVLLLRQCEATDKAKSEVSRVENNWKASLDTIRNYKDANGNSVAEIRALKLTIDEVKDSLKLEKGKDPVTVIEYRTKIVEKIEEVPVTRVDTIIGDFNSALTFGTNQIWGKSTRSIEGSIPFIISGDSIRYGNANIDLEQNIWLSAAITQDRKSKEVFVNLKTDYPGTTFNGAKGIAIDQSSINSYNKQNRKTLGIGLNIGIGYTGNGISPFVGIGINYTPKLLQW